MALSYNLGYQEIISVHPTRRQNFAGKPYSNFPNIWQWLISSSGRSFRKAITHTGYDGRHMGPRSLTSKLQLSKWTVSILDRGGNRGECAINCQFNPVQGNNLQQNEDLWLKVTFRRDSMLLSKQLISGSVLDFLSAGVHSGVSSLRRVPIHSLRGDSGISKKEQTVFMENQIDEDEKQKQLKCQMNCYSKN